MHDKKLTIEIVPSENNQHGVFDFKIPCEQNDAFGNKVIMYNKETVNLAQINEQISNLKKRLTELNERKQLIKDFVRSNNAVGNIK